MMYIFPNGGICSSLTGLNPYTFKFGKCERVLDDHFVVKALEGSPLKPSIDSIKVSSKMSIKFFDDDDGDDDDDDDDSNYNSNVPTKKPINKATGVITAGLRTFCLLK